MILLVCGTRTLTSKVSAEVLAKSRAAQAATFLVVGDSDGPDTHAKKWAEARGIRGACLVARWEQEGRAAGPNRNTRLVNRTLVEMRLQDLPAACVAIWDADSPGTLDTITKVLAAGIELEPWIVKGGPPRQATPSELANLISRAEAALARRRQK